MKTRNGFVSNSSSSSYIIILPKNANYEMLKANVLKRDLTRLMKECNVTEKQVERGVKSLIKDGCLWYDPYDTNSDSQVFYVIQSMVQPYMIATAEGGADQGNSIVAANREKVEQLIGGSHENP